MGAWGYNAADSDSGLDWISDVTDITFWDKVKDALQGEGEDSCPSIVRAAALLTATLAKGFRCSLPMEYDIREIAISALNKVLDDKDWLAGWDNPQAVKASIRKDITLLEESKVRT